MGFKELTVIPLYVGLLRKVKWPVNDMADKVVAVGTNYLNVVRTAQEAVDTWAENVDIISRPIVRHYHLHSNGKVDFLFEDLV